MQEHPPGAEEVEGRRAEKLDRSCLKPSAVYKVCACKEEVEQLTEFRLIVTEPQMQKLFRASRRSSVTRSSSTVCQNKSASGNPSSESASGVPASGV